VAAFPLHLQQWYKECEEKLEGSSLELYSGFTSCFCVGGPRAVVIPSEDLAAVTGEEKCTNEPLCSSCSVIVASLFLLECCLKSRGHFKNDWINRSRSVWSSF